MKPNAIVTCLLFAGAGACGAPATTDASVAELKAALPTRASLALLPAATSDGAAAAPSSTCAALGPARFGTLTHQIAGNADGVLGGVLGTVEKITATPPGQAAPGHAVWGPIAAATAPVIYRLEVAAGAPSEFHFVLAGKPAAAGEDAWRGLFQGTTAAPDATHHAGEVAIDFAVVHALDPSSDPLAGNVGLRFVSDGAARNVNAAFAGISAKGAPQPDDAAYAFTQAANGAVGLAFSTRVDFDGDGSLDELAHIDSRWAPSGSGVAHLTVAGGSLGPATVTAVECWSPSLTRVFYSDSAGAATEGDPACCPQ